MTGSTIIVFITILSATCVFCGYRYGDKIRRRVTLTTVLRKKYSNLSKMGAFEKTVNVAEKLHSNGFRTSIGENSI